MKDIDPGPLDYLVKCIAGCFRGRFVHVNQGSGELFGADAGGSEVSMCIEGAGLSDRHARITFNAEAGQYFLSDAGSATGTWVATRWRRSVEVCGGQELQAGAAPALELRRGRAVEENEEVAEWLAAYQLRHLAAELHEHGVRSFADVRASATRILDLVGASCNEAEEQSVLSLAVSELDRMFPQGKYAGHMLELVLRPAEEGSEVVKMCEVSWAGGVVSFAPDGTLQDRPPCPPSAAEGATSLGVVPGTGWKDWAHLKIGYSFGRYYVHNVSHTTAENSERCFVRLSDGQQHWLQPQDVFRIGSLEFQVLRFNVGVHAEQGMRPSMEDEDLVMQDLTISHWRNTAMFAVYDGHGGRSCVEHVRRILHVKLIDAVAAAGGLDDSPQVLHELHDALRSSFLQTDSDFLNLVATMGKERESGTAAVAVLVLGGHLWCANCGDSRAVLCRAGRAVQLSLDHKPTRPDEQARIEAAGGFVTFARVMGRLAVSRALGDVDCKLAGPLAAAAGGTARSGAGPMITAEPEIRAETLSEEDEFLLLACDGLFDVFSSQEAVTFARERLARLPPCEQDPMVVAKELAQEAIFGRGSRDNVSVVIVAFKRTVRL